MPSTSPMARLVAKTVLNLGMSIASHSMLPIERSERLYTTAEDTIPIMFKANMIKSEVYDPILQEVNTEEKIDGYLNEPMYATFTQGHFFLIVAAPGAGKTMLMKGIIGDLLNNGYLVVCPADMKNDFYECKYPVQRKFREHMPPWRHPKKLPVYPIVPQYIIYNRPELEIVKKYPDVKPFQLSIADMKPEDLIYVFDLEKKSDVQARLLTDIWYPDDPPKSVQGLVSRIQNADLQQVYKDLNIPYEGEFAKKSRDVLVQRVLSAAQYRFIGDSARIDIADLVDKGFFVNVCLFDSNYYPINRWNTAYEYAIMRVLYDAKSDGGKIGMSRRMVIIAPDIGKTLLPNRITSKAKDFVNEQIISLGRRKKIYLLGDTQNLSQIQEDILLQVQSWAIFARTSGYDLEKIAKATKKRYSIIRDFMEKHQHEMEKPSDKYYPRGCVLWQPPSQPKPGFVGSPQCAHEASKEERYELAKEAGYV